MILAFKILFWLTVFMIFHTYLLFPIILKLLTINKKLIFKDLEEYKEVTIIMSLYNEESVISEKLDSIFASDYPLDKIKIIIGSDNSNDNTNFIVESYAKKYSNIDFTIFTQRQGKSNVINGMIEKSKSEILILSDANVFFDKNTIKELIKPFSDQTIGLVDSHMKNTGLKKEGISIQEKTYISREVYIKHRESILWGSMMGPFGGCFAIRRELYSPVPKNFLVDDFYLCMKVLEMGYKAINNINALVYEDVSNNLSDEFRRKARIATGDFQNLNEFKHLLWPPWKGSAFSFLSHKVLRWISPIFLIVAWGTNFFLAFHYNLYLIIFALYSFVLLLPIVDFLLKKINFHNIILRFITHFITMNIALFIGMFRAMKGVKSNVWKPTKRNQ